jgi:uncharacterized protein YceH (UPF0502 family)
VDAVTDNGAVISAVLALLAGGVTALVSLRKLKPESDRIIVDAAKDVVVIQRGVVEDLNRRMGDMEDRFNGQLEAAERARQAAEAALAAERDANAELRAENRELRVRVDALEVEVAKLRAVPRPIEEAP